MPCDEHDYRSSHSWPAPHGPRPGAYWWQAAREQHPPTLHHDHDDLRCSVGSPSDSIVTKRSRSGQLGWEASWVTRNAQFVRFITNRVRRLFAKEICSCLLKTGLTRQSSPRPTRQSSQCGRTDRSSETHAERPRTS
jgi:hypothetical protein